MACIQKTRRFREMLRHNQIDEFDARRRVTVVIGQQSEWFYVPFNA
jgi:hypothetical protein